MAIYHPTTSHPVIPTMCGPAENPTPPCPSFYCQWPYIILSCAEADCGYMPAAHPSWEQPAATAVSLHTVPGFLKERGMKKKKDFAKLFGAGAPLGSTPGHFSLLLGRPRLESTEGQKSWSCRTATDPGKRTPPAGKQRKRKENQIRMVDRRSF